jgi:hypothetical protein
LSIYDELDLLSPWVVRLSKITIFVISHQRSSAISPSFLKLLWRTGTLHSEIKYSTVSTSLYNHNTQQSTTACGSIATSQATGLVVAAHPE